MKLRLLLTAGLLACILHRAYAQVVLPRIISVSPTGGQKGSTVELTLTGVHIGQATGILFDGAGIEVESLVGENPPENTRNPAGKLIAKVRIAPDAVPGIRTFRVLTPWGISGAGLFVVDPWLQKEEKEPNNTLAVAEEISTPVTIRGKLDPGEDVDCFRVRAKAGQTLVCQVIAARIGSPLESVLTVMDARGREVAIEQDFATPDSQLAYTVPRDGDYIVRLRDLNYRGGGEYHYRLTIGSIPLVTTVFPAGGRAGTTVALTLDGYNLGPARTAQVTLPSEATAEPFEVTLSLPEGAAHTFLMAAGNVPEILEVEPNDRLTAAQAIALPAIINGRISSGRAGTEDRQDLYRFALSAGQKWVFEVAARRLGSRMDAQISVLDTAGKELASNDDAAGKDSRLEFTPAQTGEYLLRVTDLSGRQGTECFYRLSALPAEPDFRLSFAPDRPVVFAGGRAPLAISLERRYDFDGDVMLQITGLPAGVTVLGKPVIPKGRNEVWLALAAPDGSTVQAGTLTISGEGTARGQLLRRRGRPMIEAYVKEGDNVVRRLQPSRFAIASTAGAPDILLEVSPARIALAAGQSADIAVAVTRRTGFEGKVLLDVRGLPPGVTATTAEIPEKQNSAKVTLKAEANSPAGEFEFLIVGRVSPGDLDYVSHASQPLTLSLSK